MKKGLTGALIILLSFICLEPIIFAEAVTYESDGRRDPFLPLIGPGGLLTKAPKKGLMVEGIIYDPFGTSMVIVGDETYQEGDNLYGSNLISILQDRIIVSQDDEEATIWIHEEILRGDKKS